jgi:hypothetical protein
MVAAARRLSFITNTTTRSGRRGSVMWWRSVIGAIKRSIGWRNEKKISVYQATMRMKKMTIRELENGMKTGDWVQYDKRRCRVDEFFRTETLV